MPTPLQLLTEHGQSVWIDYLSRPFVRDGDLGRPRATRASSASRPTRRSSRARSPRATPTTSSSARCCRPRATRRRSSWRSRRRTSATPATCCGTCSSAARRRATAGSRSRSTRTSPTTPRRTIEEAKRLHAMIERPNLFVKIPGTEPGLQRDRGVDRRRHPDQRHAAVLAPAPPRGGRGVHPRPAAACATSGGDLSSVASVASFFVSRVDTEADRRLDEIGGHDELKGKLAIANAKLAYQTYKEIFSGPEWEELEQPGASPQRCLWASTSTKNPDYRDVIYVEELIGPDTVNTMPRETIEAFQDHGQRRATRSSSDVDGARRTLEQLRRGRASTTTTSSPCSSARASRSSPSPSRS